KSYVLASAQSGGHIAARESDSQRTPAAHFYVPASEADMPMNVNAPNANTVLPRKRKSSTLTRLVQAAVLAVILVPFGSVALEAAIISTSSCSFYYFGG